MCVYPETPSGSRKLAILKRRNQESRSQCRSAAPGLEASESPMYPRNRRPPAGPMSESSPYPEESGAPAMRSWQSAPEVPNRAGMSDGFNSPGCQQVMSST